MLPRVSGQRAVLSLEPSRRLDMALPRLPADRLVRDRR